jgi:hypothetical protein
LNSGYDDDDDDSEESGAGPEELGVSSGDDIRMECRIIYHEIMLGMSNNDMRIYLSLFDNNINSI